MASLAIVVQALIQAPLPCPHAVVCVVACDTAVVNASIFLETKAEMVILLGIHGFWRRPSHLALPYALWLRGSIFTRADLCWIAKTFWIVVVTWTADTPGLVSPATFILFISEAGRGPAMKKKVQVDLVLKGFNLWRP